MDKLSSAGIGVELDYSPFGSVLEGRNWSGGSEYRYGFNGKEQDLETYGEGNIYDYGFRIYNPRLGKFLSVDPLTKSYAELTPYQFASNRPIDGIDLDGLEYLRDEDARFKYVNGETRIDIQNNGNIAEARFDRAQSANFNNKPLTTIDKVGTFGFWTFTNTADFKGSFLDMPNITDAESVSLSPQMSAKYFVNYTSSNYNSSQKVGSTPIRFNIYTDLYEIRFVSTPRLTTASKALIVVEGVSWAVNFICNINFNNNMNKLDKQYYKYGNLINEDIKEAGESGIINPTFLNDETFMSNVANWLLRGTLSNVSGGASNFSMSEADYTNLVVSTAERIWYGISMSNLLQPEATPIKQSELIKFDGTGLRFENQDY